MSQRPANLCCAQPIFAGNQRTWFLLSCRKHGIVKKNKVNVVPQWLNVNAALGWKAAAELGNVLVFFLKKFLQGLFNEYVPRSISMQSSKLLKEELHIRKTQSGCSKCVALMAVLSLPSFPARKFRLIYHIL